MCSLGMVSEVLLGMYNSKIMKIKIYNVNVNYAILYVCTHNILCVYMILTSVWRCEQAERCMQVRIIFYNYKDYLVFRVHYVENADCGVWRRKMAHFLNNRAVKCFYVFLCKVCVTVIITSSLIYWETRIS